jgi:hypothetical protein
VGLAFDIGEYFARAHCEAVQGLFDRGVEDAEGFKGFVAQPVTGVGGISVAGVAQWFDTGLRADSHRLLATEDEEGANEALGLGAGYGRLWEHAANAANAAAANDVHEHRFGLVVERVAGGDAISAFFAGDEGEELVAHLAGDLFDALALLAGGRGDIAFAREALDSESSAEFAHEGEVGGGFGTELVVEVAGNDFEAKGPAEFEQDEKERDGIRSAGDGCEDLFRAAEELLFGGEAADARGELAVGNVGDALGGLEVWCARERRPGCIGVRCDGFAIWGRAAATSRRLALLRSAAAGL